MHYCIFHILSTITIMPWNLSHNIIFSCLIFHGHAFFRYTWKMQYITLKTKILKTWKSRKNFFNLHIFSILPNIIRFLSGVLLLHHKLSNLFCSLAANLHIFSHSGIFPFWIVYHMLFYLFSFMGSIRKRCKFKMAFAMKGGGGRGFRVPLRYFEKNCLKTI